MLETYFSTARSVITSLSAMLWLDSPAAIRSSTSRSRGISSSRGPSWHRLDSSVDTITGSSAEPPRPMRRRARPPGRHLVLQYAASISAK